MSLRKNVLANYLSQFYITALGFIAVPLYLHFTNADTYGLISIFSTIQALFGLLDVGLSPTLARDSARLKSKNISLADFERTLTALSFLFTFVGAIGSLAVYLAAGPIAEHWLKSSQIPSDQILLCLQIMSPGIFFRWQSGLYRGVITGHEELAWVSGTNSIVATLRFIVPTPLLAHPSSLEWFFAYQSILALSELIVLRSKAVATTGAKKPSLKYSAFREQIITPIREKAALSASLAFTSSLWIIVTQSDKIILSGLLKLDEYAYFSQAALASSAIFMLSLPISSSFIPKIIGLSNFEQRKDQITLYRRLTSLVTAVVFPAALTLALCAQEILHIWTRDPNAAQQGHFILVMYATGYAILSTTSLAAHLQVASGRMELHVKGSLFYAALFFIQLPTLTINLGANGAGIAWLTTNALYLLVWIPLIHKRQMPGEHVD